MKSCMLLVLAAAAVGNGQFHPGSMQIPCFEPTRLSGMPFPSVGCPNPGIRDHSPVSISPGNPGIIPLFGPPSGFDCEQGGCTGGAAGYGGTAGKWNGRGSEGLVGGLTGGLAGLLWAPVGKWKGRNLQSQHGVSTGGTSVDRDWADGVLRLGGDLRGNVGEAGDHDRTVGGGKALEGAASQGWNGSVGLSGIIRKDLGPEDGKRSEYSGDIKARGYGTTTDPYGACRRGFENVPLRGGFPASGAYSGLEEGGFPGSTGDFGLLTIGADTVPNAHDYRCNQNSFSGSVLSGMNGIVNRGPTSRGGCWGVPPIFQNDPSITPTFFKCNKECPPLMYNCRMPPEFNRLPITDQPTANQLMQASAFEASPSKNEQPTSSLRSGSRSSVRKRSSVPEADEEAV